MDNRDELAYDYSFPSRAKGFLLGGIAGGLFGFGSLYLANKLGFDSKEVGFPLDYIALGTAATGAVGNLIFTHLRSKNIDRNPGNLILENGFNHQPTPQTPFQLEGLGSLVNLISIGVENNGISQQIYNSLRIPLARDPFVNAHLSYADVRDGFLANEFGVFDSFNYNGERINPKLTLDEFFENGHKLHKFTVDRVSREAGKLSGSKNHAFESQEEHIKWYNSVSDILDRELLCANNIALWTNYLAQREGVVGNTVREKLTNLGISNPRALPDDVKKIGNTLRSFYDTWETKQIENYKS